MCEVLRRDDCLLVEGVESLTWSCEVAYRYIKRTHGITELLAEREEGI